MVRKIPKDDIPKFLWEHLDLDMKLLSQSMGYSLDETAMVMHLLGSRLIHDDMSGKL